MTSRNGERLTEGRQPRSVNRYVRQVMAGLNRAVELGHIGNPAAWILKPLQDDVEDDGETAVFLDPNQRKSLVEAATPAAAAFLRGLALTGARPSELAGSTVRDFDKRRVSSLKEHVRHRIRTHACLRRRQATPIVLRILNVRYGEGSSNLRPAGVGRLLPDGLIYSGHSARRTRRIVGIRQICPSRRLGVSEIAAAKAHTNDEN